MGTPLPVEEFEVDVEGLVLPGEAYREPPLHAVEEEGPVAGVAFGSGHRLARPGRHEDLRLEPGGGDFGRLRNLGGEDSVGDQEDVGVEAGAFVAGAHLRDHAVDADGLTGGQDPLQGHDVVELEVLARRHRHPELERGGVFGSYHPSDHFAHGPSVTEACDTGVASPTARRLCHAGR